MGLPGKAGVKNAKPAAQSLVPAGPDACRLLTPDEVADLLSLTRQAVIKKAREGTIPSLKLGKAVRFRLAAIDAWLSRQEAVGSGPA